MSKELEDLEAQVTRNRAVDAGAVELLKGLAAQIEANKQDPVKLQALADELKSSSDDLAAAVLANTPGQPPTEPPTPSERRR